MKLGCTGTEASDKQERILQCSDLTRVIGILYETHNIRIKNDSFTISYWTPIAFFKDR